MTTGLYDDAIKAYSNSYELMHSPISLYQRAKCFIAVGNIEQAYDDLVCTLKISSNDRVVMTDKKCLNALRTCIIKKNYESALSKISALIPGE